MTAAAPPAAAAEPGAPVSCGAIPSSIRGNAAGPWISARGWGLEWGWFRFAFDGPVSGILVRGGATFGEKSRAFFSSLFSLPVLDLDFFLIIYYDI